MGLTTFLYWWSNPVRGAPAGRGANPEAGIMFYPTWGGGGDRGDRMIVGHDEWGNVWYQANWHSPEGDFLVIVQEGHAHMFYDFWSVVVLDRSMNVVRRGSVGLSTDTTPYRLVEVRTDDPAAPAVIRGKWRLSVGWKPPEHLGESDDAGDSLQRAQVESLNPVEWPDDPESLNRNFVRAAPDLRIRPAGKGAE
ncbi:MAG TPA: hypothetical protein VFC46_11650 [Humisphaera sp.]|nr:hypothetical protein [Humisphaera sp.]